MPFNKEDYLRLGTIVIDRYKMPGLNPEGTGIAEDMAYGFGDPNSKSKQIYTDEEINQYIKEYTESGFDINSQYEFANAAPHIEYLPETVVTAKHKPDSKENNTPSGATIDKTYVEKPKILTMEIIEKIKELNKKSIYSKEECYNTSYKFISTGLDTKIFDKIFSDSQLFWNFENTAELYFAQGELQQNLERMIAKFKRNEGGIYEDEVLTNAIIKNPATVEYCKKIEGYIVKQLKKSFFKLEDVEDKEPYFEKEINGEKTFINKRNIDRKDIGKNNFSKPAYIWKKDWNVLRGETIALNDIWATEIILKELTFTDNESYIAKYQITLWDHFGLNLTDMEKIFNIIPSVGDIFVCWFILQHLRGYKPFITKITFERELIGSLL